MDFSWSIGVDKDVENGIGLLLKSVDSISIQFAILLKEIVCCRMCIYGKDIKFFPDAVFTLRWKLVEIEGNFVELTIYKDFLYFVEDS